jgi:hypothetical protein
MMAFSGGERWIIHITRCPALVEGLGIIGREFKTPA